MGRRAPHHLTWWIVEHLGEAGIDVENMITIVRDEHTLIESVEQRLHWQKPFRFFYSHGLLTPSFQDLSNLRLYAPPNQVGRAGIGLNVVQGR